MVPWRQFEVSDHRNAGLKWIVIPGDSETGGRQAGCAHREVADAHFTVWDMVSPEPRASRAYLLGRAYAALAICVWCAATIWALYCMLRRDDVGALFVVLFSVPLFIPALFMILNWCAFPFPYSIFGRFRRTRFPRETPDCVVAHSWIVIGRHFRSTWPSVTWTVFPSGIGISIELIGRVFIPKEHILRVRRDWVGRGVLEHTSVEVRTPLTMPGNVSKALEVLSFSSTPAGQEGEQG